APRHPAHTGPPGPRHQGDQSPPAEPTPHDHQEAIPAYPPEAKTARPGPPTRTASPPDHPTPHHPAPPQPPQRHAEKATGSLSAWEDSAVVGVLPVHGLRNVWLRPLERSSERWHDICVERVRRPSRRGLDVGRVVGGALLRARRELALLFI